MNKKELVFRSVEIKENRSNFKTLQIYCYNDGTLTVNDGEILENENSPETVLFTHIDSDERETETTILVHKKDILPLASFLLEIYNEYDKRRDDALGNDYLEHVKSEMKKKE